MSSTYAALVAEWRKNVAGAKFLGKPVEYMPADFLLVVIGYFIGEKRRLEDELRRLRDLADNVVVEPDPKDLSIRVVGGPYSGRRYPLDGCLRVIDDGGGYDEATYRFRKVDGEWELHWVKEEPQG